MKGRPYLRTALNNDKMSDDGGRNRAAPRSREVLTGAMFDVLIAIGRQAIRRTNGGRGRKPPRQAFWHAADRMQRMAIQPLDLLPPVDVTFRDYALAVCRSQQLADPLDPDDYSAC